MNEKKLEETGKKLQNIGCILTLMFTIPIVLTFILGIPGLIIGIIIAILGIVGILSKKKTEPLNKMDSLLIKATATKEMGDINKAIELLKEAYSEINKTSIIYPIETFLRLPLYLQKADRGDEAWKEFNKLILSTTSNSEIMPMDHSIIYDKMRLFLQREEKNKLAVRFGLFSYFSWAIGLYRQDRKKELNEYLTELNYNKKIQSLLKKADLLEFNDEFINLLNEEKLNLPNINFHELAKKIDKIYIQNSE